MHADLYFMLFLRKIHIQQILKYASVIWNSGNLQDKRKLELVQAPGAMDASGIQVLEDKEYGGHFGVWRPL